ncbi:MAG: MBL fold metallo-hydrolase [Thermodesulfobacteriota bacterium]
MAIEATWLGTAGFRIKAEGAEFLIDPWLRRNPEARPRQPLQPEDLAAEIKGQGLPIFITHGHFDHLQDVPLLAQAGSTAHVSVEAARTLAREGVDPGRIVRVEGDGQAFDLGAYRAAAFFSRHVKFDLPLVIKTLWRAGRRVPALMPLMKKWPAGQVLSWRFELAGRTLHHFGSGGSTPEELGRLAKNPPEVLFAPLQGHSRIHRIALEYVRALKPKTVVVHHQDDFFPPISQMVPAEPLVEMVRQEAPGIRVIVPELNRPFIL